MALGQTLACGEEEPAAGRGDDAGSENPTEDAAAPPGTDAESSGEGICGNYEKYTPPFEPSFAVDVMPRLQTTCNGTGCHGGDSDEAAADLWLGPNSDVVATQDDLKRVVQALVGDESRTADGVMLVEPGKPGESFFMLKLDDCHNEMDLECEALPNSISQAGCGDPMPQGVPNAFSEDELDVFRSWIALGAENN